MKLYPQDTLNGPVRYYYPGGTQVSSEGLLRDGRPDGYWKTYYPDGTLKSEGNRVEGKLDSIWRFYSPEGLLKTAITYRSDKKNGLKQNYDEQARLISEEQFSEDVKEGWSVQYFSSGTVRFRIFFREGREEGRGVEYDETGLLRTLFDYKGGVLIRQQRVNRLDRSNRKTGSWVELYEDYQTKRETQYAGGLKNGYLKEYDRRGNLVKIEKYVDDILQKEAAELERPEVRREYYPGAKVKKIGSYSKGIPVGLHITYDTSGAITEAALYENGFVTAIGLIDENNRKQGLWKEFYPGGTIKAEGLYEDDRKTGTWMYYHLNGKTEQTGKYTKGNPVGLWKWYFESGALLREEYFLNGLEDGLSVEFDEKGDTVSRGEYIDGEREGSWLFRQGNQQIRGYFKAGKMDGEWKHYFDNGRLSFSGKFADGEPTGRHQAYYETGTIKWEGKYVAGKREGEWKSYAADGTLNLTIDYRNGIEIRYDGIRIKPEFEPADFDNLLQENPYMF